MKKLTPMKRYKTAIDNLRSQVRGHSHEFTLNKAESRRIPWVFARSDKYETKGVECDFIMIFESLENKGFSFALTFTYMDKEQDEQLVCGSVKFGDELDQTRYGEPMPLEKFKESLNSLNKKLTTIDNKSYDEIINVFSEVFLQTTFSLADDIEKASAEIKQFVAEKTAELDIKLAEDVSKLTRESYSTATANVDAALKASEAYKEREELLERLARLDKVLTNKKVLLNKQEEVSIKEKAKKKADETLQSKKFDLSMQLNKKLLDYPKAIRTRIVN
jgi:hypothetical protein